MPRLRGEHVVLIAGLALIAFAAVQAFRDRSDWLPWAAGVALIALGLFRQQLRNLKFGPGGVELAVSEALTAESSESARRKLADPEDADAAVVEQLAKATQPSDLKLLISTVLPMGMAETIMGTDHAIQVTAVNTSDRPIGVNSLGLSLTDGRSIPVYDAMPTDRNIKLPAVLKPQETAATYLHHGPTRDALREAGVRIKEIVAHLADGSTRREPVPDDWAKLGDAD
jgi:hypothetical protein